MKATDRFSVSATEFSDQLRKSGKQSGKAERNVMFYEVALKTRRRRKKHKEKNHKNLLRFLRSRSGQAGPESGHKSWQRFAQTDLQIAGEKCRENKKQINSEHRERSRKNTERAKKKTQEKTNNTRRLEFPGSTRTCVIICIFSSFRAAKSSQSRAETWPGGGRAHKKLA